MMSLSPSSSPWTLLPDLITPTAAPTQSFLSLFCECMRGWALMSNTAQLGRAPKWQRNSDPVLARYNQLFSFPRLCPPSPSPAAQKLQCFGSGGWRACWKIEYMRHHNFHMIFVVSNGPYLLPHYLHSNVRLHCVSVPAGLSSSLSNPSIQASLNNCQLQSSLSNPSINSSLRMSNNSPRRRPAPISPLTLSPGTEQRRGLAKQLSPTMSPSLSPITQVHTPHARAWRDCLSCNAAD